MDDTGPEISETEQKVALPDADPSSAADVKFLNTLEDTLRGIVRFSGAFLNTFWVLAVRRRALPSLLGNTSQRVDLLGPYTFLALASLPGSIYYQAVALAWKRHASDVQSVALNLQKLLAEEFSIARVVLVALPIVAVTASAGFLLSRAARHEDTATRSLIQESACYALGFSMLCMVFSGGLPFLLRNLLSSQVQAGGVAAGGQIPLWMAYSGFPFAVYGVLSAGHILVSVARPTGLRKIAWFLAGPATLYVCLLAVWLVALMSWPKASSDKSQAEKDRRKAGAFIERTCERI